MIANKAEYEYIICNDTITIYHPESTYTIQDILEEYLIKPTEPVIVTYKKSLVKAEKDFEKFIIENELKARYSNTLHCESCLTINLLVLYDKKWNIKGIAARTIKNNFIQNEKERIYVQNTTNKF